MPRVVHFDLPAEDPEKLKAFYEKVFGWQFQKWTDPSGQMEYWLITTGKDEPGIDGGMAKKRAPDEQVANTISVPNLEEYMKKIQENGGKLIMGKAPIPGIGWLASFEDPQGIKHMILQDDKNAK
jgi:predicted enzyme related to lactoylglutathione lyase